MSYADRVLTCRDCGQEFVFSAGEQEFYALKGLTNEPGRCRDCRSARRSGRMSADGEMAVRREYHMAVCAECGGEARVPFLPRGDRPVYCSNCFDQVRVR